MPSDPSDTGLPALPRAKGVAESLEHARPGHMMAVDAAGNVVGLHSRAAWIAALPLLGVLATGVALMLVVPLLFGLLAGNLVFVLTMLVALAMWWPTRGVARAMQRFAADDLAGAERGAASVARGAWVPALWRCNAFYIAGSAAWLRGRLDDGLAYTRRAIEIGGYPRSGSRRVIVALARLNEIQLLAIKGDLAAARARLAELERDGLPSGDLVRIQRIDTELVLAFEAGDPSMLPRDLDDWVQAVLRTNRFGSTLVLLAWAHTQRADAELVPTLLDVAYDRLPECHIDEAHPRLAAWLRTIRG
jgi:hypothetical protein